jgi:hypothetical protein
MPVEQMSQQLTQNTITLFKLPREEKEVHDQRQ